MRPIAAIAVEIWGKQVGAIARDPRLGYYAFEYSPAWKRSGVELAPLTLPVDDQRKVFIFSNLPQPTFHRLPSSIADALPDDFGNALIDAWMARQGIEKNSITILDRLAY